MVSIAWLAHTSKLAERVKVAMGVRRKFPRRRQLRHFAIFSGLLTLQCNWTFTKSFFRLSKFFFYPLLGRARFRGRCWAAIRLFQRPETSGRAVRGGSMDWTLDDDTVDGLFFCATFTGRRGGYTLFVQTGAETSDTGAEMVKPDPGSSWEGHSRDVCTGVRN